MVIPVLFIFLKIGRILLRWRNFLVRLFVLVAPPVRVKVMMILLIRFPFRGGPRLSVPSLIPRPLPWVSFPKGVMSQSYVSALVPPVRPGRRRYFRRLVLLEGVRHNRVSPSFRGHMLLTLLLLVIIL